MERFDETGNVLLGYNRQQRSFGSDPSSSNLEQQARKDSDETDFNDVFGGPPRRFSMHETRYSFGGGKIEVDSAAIVPAESRSSWPVFGESYSSPRRRTSDDFYDDIFRGSDDSYSSPRRSRPGSRIMSPAHPKFEPPLSTSVPAQFSLPAKLTKAIDLPTFSSGNRSPHRFKEGTSGVHAPNTPLSRFSSLTMQGQDDFRNNPEQSPGLSSNQSSSLSVDESLYLNKHTENETERNSRGNIGTKGAPNSSNEFHFSIHKWPGREVPLLASIRGGKKPTFKASSKVDALSTVNVQDADILDDGLSVDDRGDMKSFSLSKMGLSEGTEKEISMLKQEVYEHEIKRQGSLLNDEIEGQGDEDIDRKAEGKENMERITGSLNSNVETTVSKRNETKKMSTNRKVEANKSAVGLPKSSGENLGKSRVKGKVKEFVKIFNEEGPPKSKMNAVARSLSSRWKTTGSKKSDRELSDSTPELDSKAPTASSKMMPDASHTAALDGKVHVGNVKMMPDVKIPAANKEMMPDASTTATLDDKVPASNVKMMQDASHTTEVDSKVPAANVKMMPDASFVDEHIEKSSKQKFGQNRTIKTIDDVQFDRMNASPSTESVPPGTEVTTENIDEPSLENFHVQELSPDEDTLSKTEEESEAFRASDAKIRLWSNGRKGNIRSLLSTLQLVLWPESGWKPVALVDIIEANAVKKAYNRAMLCLHPDKLQQKGAASHQKYLAEKVFDILQEAWDHFNSLGTLL